MTDAYISTTAVVMLAALYISVSNHGLWPAFRTLRLRHAVLLTLLAWAAVLIWPNFLSALPVAYRWDQPASARVFIAPNPGSWEYRFGASRPGSRIVRPDLLRPSAAAASVAPHAALISALRTTPLHAQQAHSPRPAGR